MSVYGAADTEPLEPMDEDTLVSSGPPAGCLSSEDALAAELGDSRPRRFAEGTGEYPSIPAPAVPAGARARGKRHWLGRRIVRVHSLLLGSTEPRSYRK